MDLLTAIHNEVLVQMEQEARNLFSTVDDFRAYILSTHPAPDVLVTLKLRCTKVERLDCDQGTCVTLIDASLRVVLEPTEEVLTDLVPHERVHFIAQVTVWDADLKRRFFGKPVLNFQPGAVYKFNQVEYVGIYDGIPRGTIQLERDHHGRICMLG
jgi:hypothetical protein